MTEQVAELTEQLDTCLAELRGARREVEEYADYCTRNGLPLDAEVITALTGSAHQAGRRLSQQRQLLVHATGELATLLTASENVLRFGLATLAYVRGALEWCAQSYAQSGATQFFHLSAQDSPMVNYERYDHRAVQRIERQLLEVLDLSPKTHGLIVTSSGMASFSAIESFLIRDRLSPGDTVLLAPYIYFESEEQLTALPFVRIERASGYGVEDIVSAVVEHKPKCLFVDQVANTAQQRMVDLATLFKRLREVATGRLTVVVDGSMLAAALPAELLTSDERLEVLYYESCTKYLQLGLDEGMAGLVAYPVESRERFERVRRNGGLVLYRHSAELFPRYQRSVIRRRMVRICANAERLATLLNGDPRVRAAGTITHPLLRDHPDVLIARNLPYASGFVTFQFHERDRNTRDGLNAVIDEILVNARGYGVQLTKGASFGFSAPRASAADAFAEGEPPFLRLYAGDRAEQVDSLAAAISWQLGGMADRLAA
jgi:cystathionine gamma-synthase